MATNTLNGKIEVQVAGKKYPCHLSMNSFRLLCESEYLQFNEMQDYLQKKPLTAVPKVLYFGMVNAAHYNKSDVAKLPEFEYVAAHILDDQSSLEKYTELIGKAFGGEDADPESGNA